MKIRLDFGLVFALCMDLCTIPFDRISNAPVDVPVNAQDHSYTTAESKTDDSHDNDEGVPCLGGYIIVPREKTKRYR